jgi:hypothetical protein
LGSVGIFSPVAVVRLMVGREICEGEGLLRRACCWATKASRRTAASVFDLGEPPKSDVNLLPFAKDARRAESRFSLEGSRGGAGAVDANGLMLRTGIAAMGHPTGAVGIRLRGLKES